MGDRTDRITETVDHIVQGIEYLIFETASTDHMPDLFDGIHFRRIRWDMEKVDVVRNNEGV